MRAAMMMLLLLTACQTYKRAPGVSDERWNAFMDFCAVQKVTSVNPKALCLEAAYNAGIAVEAEP